VLELLFVVLVAERSARVLRDVEVDLGWVDLVDRAADLDEVVHPRLELHLSVGLSERNPLDVVSHTDDRRTERVASVRHLVEPLTLEGFELSTADVVALDVKDTLRADALREEVSVVSFGVQV